MKIMVLSGVNINMIGIREKDVYGKTSIEEHLHQLKKFGEARGHEMHFRHSNCEGELIDHIHSLYFEKFDVLIFNTGALCHTSYALKDAIKASNIPFYAEVHFRNSFAASITGAYRSIEITAQEADFMCLGAGIMGYKLAIEAAEEKLLCSTHDEQTS